MSADDYPLATIVTCLEKAIRCEVGMAALDILLHGWIRATGCVSRCTLRARKARDGQAWLSPDELASLSRYAGYDLSLHPQNRDIVTLAEDVFLHTS